MMNNDIFVCFNRWVDFFVYLCANASHLTYFHFIGIDEFTFAFMYSGALAYVRECMRKCDIKTRICDRRMTHFRCSQMSIGFSCAFFVYVDEWRYLYGDIWIVLISNFVFFFVDTISVSNRLIEASALIKLFLYIANHRVCFRRFHSQFHSVSFKHSRYQIIGLHWRWYSNCFCGQMLLHD